MPPVKEKTGLILVDHGSKRQAANDMLHDVVAMYKRITGEAIVEAAHMELSDPTIEQAFDACVKQGAGRVIVHPYFLSPGRHSQSDIPRMVAEVAAKYPGIAFHVTAPLGLDEKIALVIKERVGHCTANNFACGDCAQREACAMAQAE
jgi:sirohydrochlorin ferrochelatase